MSMRNVYMEEIAKGTRVRLRDAIDPGIYGDFACVGNEGWVVGCRRDRFNLPEVYIQWDKNHWAYNGIADGWTVEDHFEPVKDKMKKKDKVDRLARLITDLLEDDDETEQPQLEDKGLHKQLLDAKPEEENGEAEFEHALEVVSEQLGNSEGFIVVGVAREDHPKAKDGILVPFSLGFSKTPEIDFLVASHASAVAARAHQELAIHAMTALAKTEDDE